MRWARHDLDEDELVSTSSLISCVSNRAGPDATRPWPWACQETTAGLQELSVVNAIYYEFSKEADGLPWCMMDDEEYFSTCQKGLQDQFPAASR